MNYSNPRQSATFNDWPSGGNRTTAEFVVEKTSRGERACRRTINPRTGKWGAWKKTTYAPITRIVDGDDGRTYIIQKGRHIGVIQSDLQHQQEYAFPDSERYNELNSLFE